MPENKTESQPKYKALMQPWLVLNSENQPKAGILALPGRGQSGFSFGEMYDSSNMRDSLVVGPTPGNYNWYPMPNGPKDQLDAIAGIPSALNTIEWMVNRIKKVYGIPPEKLALAGFSAGGVMAIQAALHLPFTFAAVVCHGGAILEPQNVPECNKKTPFLLIHFEDDNSFDWHERYLPMKEALIGKNWKVNCIESDSGGHWIHQADLNMAKEFLACHLGLECSKKGPPQWFTQQTSFLKWTDFRKKKSHSS